jgi:hypothetical protein
MMRKTMRSSAFRTASFRRRFSWFSPSLGVGEWPDPTRGSRLGQYDRTEEPERAVIVSTGLWNVLRRSMSAWKCAKKYQLRANHAQYLERMQTNYRTSRPADVMWYDRRSRLVDQRWVGAFRRVHLVGVVKLDRRAPAIRAIDGPSRVGRASMSSRLIALL